jgi:hypothetical protein
LLKTLLGTWVMVIFLVFDIAYYTVAGNAWEQVKGGRPSPWILDHCHLVDGACSFVTFILISNGLSAIPLM